MKAFLKMKTCFFCKKIKFRKILYELLFTLLKIVLYYFIHEIIKITKRSKNQRQNIVKMNKKQQYLHKFEMIEVKFNNTRISYA